MNNVKTLVFDIEKFAVHDGPGIRTVVFMKGCPLRCLWCHNPESQSFKPELLFNGEKCTLCGRCTVVCPQGCHSILEGKHVFDREKCVTCGLCAEGCAPEALKLCGKEMSAAEVMKEVMKDQVFYENSGGGMTLSGGEPLAHMEFTETLLKAAREKKLHTAIETSGFAPWKEIEKLLPLTDLWLWDVKAAPGDHQRLTGVPFEPILENLRKVSASGAAIILRCPLVPGVNDTEEHLISIADLANTLEGVEGIDLEPYHPMGEGKGVQLGRGTVFHAEFASEADKERWREILKKHTSVNFNIY